MTKTFIVPCSVRGDFAVQVTAKDTREAKRRAAFFVTPGAVPDKRHGGAVLMIANLQVKADKPATDLDALRKRLKRKRRWHRRRGDMPTACRNGPR